MTIRQRILFAGFPNLYQTNARLLANLHLGGRRPIWSDDSGFCSVFLLVNVSGHSYILATLLTVLGGPVILTTDTGECSGRKNNP